MYLSAGYQKFGVYAERGLPSPLFFFKVSKYYALSSQAIYVNLAAVTHSVSKFE